MLLSLAGCLGSCGNQIAEPETGAGNADFSRYMAVGNSITSGYTSSGMTKATQDNSLGNLLAKQFALVGGGNFKQPTITEKGAGVLQLQSIGLVPPCDVDLKPVIVRSEVDPNWTINVAASGPFNNIAVPGMSIKSTATAASNIVPGNAFFTRMVSNPSTSYKDLVSETATAINPSFFTLWLGNNDVLTTAGTGGGYVPNYFTSATVGVPCQDLPLPLLAPPSDDDFRQKFKDLLDIVTANGAKGAVATIPDILALPLFNTVKNTVTNTNSCSETLPIYITVSNTVRVATDDDHILLPTGNFIGRLDTFTINGSTLLIPHGLNEANPLCNSEVLDKDEKLAIRTKTETFNAIIKQEAAAKSIAVVDMYTFLNSIKDGAVYDGVAVSSDFISGGAFSLDGVHPTDRGYAIVANEFIRTINQFYDAKIPLVDVTQFKGVVIP